jgi:predicted ATP-dependent serine protease
LIVVTGPAGSGKSTLVSELGLQLERAGLRMVVLDAEMGDELATATWTRGGATKAERMGLRRITGEETEWSDALREAVRLQASVVVVDSIDEWGDLAGRDVVLADLRRNGPIATTRLVIAIAHFARDGHLFGTVKTDHRADAVVIVEPERISQTKCTWHPRCAMARKANFGASKGGLTRQKRR